MAGRLRLGSLAACLRPGLEFVYLSNIRFVRAGSKIGIIEFKRCSDHGLLNALMEDGRVRFRNLDHKKALCIVQDAEFAISFRNLFKVSND